MPLLIIIGIFGQIISIKVFLRAAHWKATCKIYYSTMAIVDLVYLISFGIPEWTGEGLDFVTAGALKFKPENYHVITCRCFRFAWHASSFASYWTLVFFSIERIIAISNPFLALNLITIRNAKKVCTAIILFAVLCFSPVIYADVYTLLWAEMDIAIEERYCFPTNEGLGQIYLFATTLGLTIIVPPIILVITSIVLIQKLSTISKERTRLSVNRQIPGKTQSAKSQEVKNAEDLLIISIITLVVALPTIFWIPTVLYGCKFIYSDFKKYLV